MTNVERVKLARETELMLRAQFNQGSSPEAQPQQAPLPMHSEQLAGSSEEVWQQDLDF